MEPHATVAVWDSGDLTLYDSTQGPWRAAATVAEAFGLDPGRVRVIAQHVGGGFGSKGTPRPHVVLAALCARSVERPVKLALTRRQMFTLSGYRTPTIQRLQLAADETGRLTAIAHDVVEQTSTVAEFAEQTAVVTRMLYASPSRRTTHRLVPLNLPTPSWMRAPGECPGMFALESALDELAERCGLDPIELRLRNEPDVDPETGNRFSTRNLVACLGRGRNGSAGTTGARDAARDGRGRIGFGVASSTYPALRAPSTAFAAVEDDGTFLIRIGAADVGTGARTALAQIAADTLEVPVGQVRVEIGDSAFGRAMLAGGSMGTSSWGAAVVEACRRLKSGESRGDGRHRRRGRGGGAARVARLRRAVRRGAVDPATGEVRVPRAARRVRVRTDHQPEDGPLAAHRRHDDGDLDGAPRGERPRPAARRLRQPGSRQLPRRDSRRRRRLDATWVDEEDLHVNPMGSKGIGEIGIVGTAAAVANAVYDATGVRVRDLPITPMKLVGRV